MISTISRDAGMVAAQEAAGSLVAIARFLGVTQQAVCKWHRMPAEHVPRVSAEYGIPPQTIRPDLYPRDIAIPLSRLLKEAA